MLEILIAMFLLAICIAMLATVFPIARASGRQAERLSTAAFLAQQVAEEIMGQAPEGWPPDQGLFPEPHQDFEYRYSTEPWPPHPGLARLRVEIRLPLSDPSVVYDLETLIFR